VRPGDRITILAKSQARFMMLGGEPLDGPRYTPGRNVSPDIWTSPSTV
jgi:redox-sensitive bicupin YhaK (pirin superfamily)